jgi:hypothetical protein
VEIVQINAINTEFLEGRLCRAFDIFGAPVDGEVGHEPEFCGDEYLVALPGPLEPAHEFKLLPSSRVSWHPPLPDQLLRVGVRIRGVPERAASSKRSIEHLLASCRLHVGFSITDGLDTLNLSSSDSISP